MSQIKLPGMPTAPAMPLEAMAALEAQNRMMEQQMHQQVRAMSLQLAASVSKQGDSATTVIATAEAFRNYMLGGK
jgi:hypothetical protein